MIIEYVKLGSLRKNDGNCNGDGNDNDRKIYAIGATRKYNRATRAARP